MGALKLVDNKSIWVYNTLIHSQNGSKMFNYRVFYNGLQRDLVASSSYEAQKLAAQLLHVADNKRYQITVILADKVIDTASL